MFRRCCYHVVIINPFATSNAPVCAWRSGPTDHVRSTKELFFKIILKQILQNCLDDMFLRCLYYSDSRTTVCIEIKISLSKGLMYGIITYN